MEEDSGIDYWTYGQLSITQELHQPAASAAEPAGQRHHHRIAGAGGADPRLAGGVVLVENAAHINVAMSLSRFETASKIGHILDRKL